MFKSSNNPSSTSTNNLTRCSNAVTAVSLLALTGAASAAAYRAYQQRKNSLSPLLTLSAQQQIQALQDIYPDLCSQFLTHIQTAYSLPQSAISRLRRLFDYTILGGKYNRACLLLNSVQCMCRHRALNINRVWHESLVAAWCIEILQALFLVADDVMDKSITRRGQPCWYKLQDVQLDAINDTLILESFLFWLLNTHCSKLKKISQLIQLYQQTSLQTQLGQMLDLLSQPQGSKDAVKLLSGFTLDCYTRIVTYKTAIYSFELPLQAGLLIVGGIDRASECAVRDISIALGCKFQIEDDYLDCYQDPSILGKIGTDIKDHKCSWLVVQALRIINGEQQPGDSDAAVSQSKRDEWRRTLYQHYGKGSDESEAIIKAMYREMKLEKIYEQQEQQSYQRVYQMIEQHKKQLPPQLFLPVLEKIHMRQK